MREGAKPTDRGRYQRLIEKLIYLSHTRPEIAYAIGVVSQFMHAPQEEYKGDIFEKYNRVNWAGAHI